MQLIAPPPNKGLLHWHMYHIYIQPADEVTLTDQSKLFTINALNISI